MAKFAFAVPVLPGKRQVLDEMTEYSRRNIEEYTQSRERAGITMERVYLMSTPMGDFTMAYVEGSRGFTEVTAAFQSGGAFDKWFLEKNVELSGMDVHDPQNAPPDPELV